MDMYRILENFDAVNSKKTLTEGSMKDWLHKQADSMSKSDFVAAAGEYGMKPEEAVEFWIAVNGDDEELDEERRSEEEWDAQALAQHKARLAREKNRRKIQQPEKAETNEAVAPAFKPGDRVMYLNGFATVVSCDGESCGIKVDGKPGTMMVPTSQIKKPSYDESVAEGDMEGDDNNFDYPEDGQYGYNMGGGGVAYGLGHDSQGLNIQDRTTGKVVSIPDFTYFDEEPTQEELAGWFNNPDEGPSMDEGNKFAYNVLKAKAAGKKQADLDGDGDMEKVQEVFPGTPEYELRFGKDDASSAFDKKKISTGTVYSRRYKDEPESDDDAPKSAGRPKGTGRKLGAKGPSVASKLLKGKGGLKEHDGVSMMDQGEYNDEAGMARQDLHTMVDAAKELHAILASDENLPEWVQSKITKALDYIDTARDYVKSSHAEQGEESIPEAGYSAKAARAGKDIGKPGKNFSKIAKGAAERYGSKEAGERVAGAVLNKLRTKEEVESVEEKAPPGAKAERMVKHIKSGYAKDGKLSDREKAIAYATTWKAKKAGQVEEESSDKKDVPFDGPYRKKGDDKDQFGNKIKHVARHAARQGLADMTTAQLKAELKRRSQVEEESTDTRDQHAEKAGKKVTKDLEYDMKHKGKDDAKAEKAGKKVTKDIEYDDKKDKKKEVEETTVSGSVAPAAGGAAPKSKNGMQFGKGVYEGQLDELDKSTLGSYVKKSKVDMVKGALAGASGAAAGDSGETDKAQKQVLKRNSGINKAIDRLTKEGVYEGQVAESFEKKLGSILNEGMSVNVSTDDTGKKSISVNATDADADALGDMLKMAGLFSSEGYSRACTDCGGIHEAGACGADMVEEELANSPDEVYTDADYMTQTLSGGLNGPKTTGQTTGPVVNRQASRQGVMAEAERVKEQAESRLWNLYKKI
jgi:hypothetical protein